MLGKLGDNLLYAFSRPNRYCLLGDNDDFTGEAPPNHFGDSEDM